jgi:hypothetical protein
MSFTKVVRKAIAAWIAPPEEKLTALVVAPSADLRPVGTWHKEGVGYRFSCCGTNYGPFDVTEPYREIEHTCKMCNRTFNLMRSLNPAGTLSVAEFGNALAALEPSTALVKTTAPAFIHQAVGDDPAVRVEWSGKQDAARDKAFEMGDPGFMGPGF